jgi:hypothetical protein
MDRVHSTASKRLSESNDDGDAMMVKRKSDYNAMGMPKEDEAFWHTAISQSSCSHRYASHKDWVGDCSQ